MFENYFYNTWVKDRQRNKKSILRMVNKMSKWSARSLFAEVKRDCVLDEVNVLFIEGVWDWAEAYRFLSTFNSMMKKQFDELSADEKKVWVELSKLMNNPPDNETRRDDDLLIARYDADSIADYDVLMFASLLQE